jgi:hypothetical protein
MRVVHSATLPWQPFSTHRAGRIENKRLLAGDEGSPDNYEFSLVLTEGDYATPRHRHNFDQIRFMLEGRFGFGPRAQEEGTVGYFCEGVHYEQNAIGRSVTLLFQGGGASGSGFMSYRQLEAGQAALRQRGEFAGGVYSEVRPDGGKRNSDAYEAIWENVNGRRIAYPAARYDQPVIIQPDAFDWVAWGDDGCASRALGRFGERGLSIDLVRLAAGATCRFRPRDLLFVLSGDGTVGGQPYGPETAIACDTDEIAIHAASETVIYAIGLPKFADTGMRIAA